MRLPKLTKETVVSGEQPPTQPDQVLSSLTQYRLNILIEPNPDHQWVDLRELWRYRELFWLFIWRDLTLRYRQTVIGAAWAILQPVITMVIFSLFLGILAGLPSNGIPYPIFTYTALVPWMFFSGVVSTSAESLVMNSAVIRKIYFPRIVLPMVYVFGGLVDFSLAFATLLVMMLFYGIYPSPAAIVFIPLLVILMLVTACGIGFMLSAINVVYRDIRHIIPFLMQSWFFITPIVYSTVRVPENLRPLFGLNPMASVVEGFRSVLLNDRTFSLPMFLISWLVSTILLLVGMIIFRRFEQRFSDVM